MDKDHSGTLDALEFAHALNLPFTQEVYDLFHLFDQDESGTIGKTRPVTFMMHPKNNFFWQTFQTSVMV
jgi:hypothetical protein